MYRWLLCFRYLRTRYIALASIISVTLGVATLIVVNSVMAGFSAEMHERLHGLASDILIECHLAQGMADPELHIEQIMEVVGDDVAGHSASVHVPAMLGIDFNGQLITRHVNFVGLDPASYDQVSQFGRYLLHPGNQQQVSFNLRDDGYAPDREGFPAAGWGYRRARVAYERALDEERTKRQAVENSNAATSSNTGRTGVNLHSKLPHPLNFFPKMARLKLRANSTRVRNSFPESCLESPLAAHVFETQTMKCKTIITAVLETMCD